MNMIIGSILSIIALFGAAWGAVTYVASAQELEQHITDAEQFQQQVIQLTNSVQQLVDIGKEEKIEEYINQLIFIESAIQKYELRRDDLSPLEIEQLGDLLGEKLGIEQKIINLRGN